MMLIIIKIKTKRKTHYTKNKTEQAEAENKVTKIIIIIIKRVKSKTHRAFACCISASKTFKESSQEDLSSW